MQVGMMPLAGAPKTRACPQPTPTDTYLEKSQIPPES